MLTKRSHKVTFVMYQDQKIARAFELDKRKLKFIFLAISLITLTSIGSWAVVLNLLSSQVEEKPPQEKPVPQKIIIREKIKAAALPYFQTSTQYQDHTGQKLINVTNINTSFLPLEATISFNLVNTTKKGDKISGYIFVLMIHNSTVSYYPQSVALTQNPHPSYEKGEPFKIAYFKQVRAKFNQKLEQGSRVIFQFYIFSEKGDLIHQETTDSLEVTQS